MVLNLKRLRAERIACGITQDEMAQMMGWKTRTPYAKRENGIVDIG
ncbi:helix-turn-helix transcriptional regulator, partial [Staphylococcus epidermidis]